MSFAIEKGASKFNMKTMVTGIDKESNMISIHADKLADAVTGSIQNFETVGALGTDGVRSLFKELRAKAGELGYDKITISYQRGGAGAIKGEFTYEYTTIKTNNWLRC